MARKITLAVAVAIIGASSPARAASVLPADTIINVTPSQELTSKHMKEGDDVAFQVANDVVESGVVAIPRGSSVRGKITWKTGKAIGGKSAKFDVTWQTVTAQGKTWALKGKWRQEGKGNTVAAVLGSRLVSGHSATMSPGQIVTAFTAEPITIQ